VKRLITIQLTVYVLSDCEGEPGTIGVFGNRSAAEVKGVDVWIKRHPKEFGEVMWNGGVLVKKRADRDGWENTSFRIESWNVE